MEGCVEFSNENDDWIVISWIIKDPIYVLVFCSVALISWRYKESWDEYFKLKELNKEKHFEKYSS